MAELLKRRLDLSVLRLTLEPDERRTVLIDLEGVRSPVLHLEATTADLGVPGDLNELYSEHIEPRFALPDHLGEELHKATRQQRADHEPLWLQFERPYGFLSLVPWERLLQPLEVPILHLPSFAVPPVASVDTLDVILCASAPMAKGMWSLSDIVSQSIDAIFETVSRGPLMIHVFVDAAWYGAMRAEVDMLPSHRRSAIKVYNPFDADAYATPEATASIAESSEAITSPWLRWMSDALAGVSADVVHFVCPGYLFVDQGALALAESPSRNEDPAWSRFVGANQLSDFLTRIGAWAVHFNAPTTTVWVLGLRLLADQMTQLRPGPVSVFDFQRGGPQPLRDLYAFLYGEADAPPPASPELTLYCHPGLVSDATEWDLVAESTSERVKRTLDELTLAKGSTRSILESDEPTPVWLAANQRYLEQSAGELIRDDESYLVEAAGVDEYSFESDAYKWEFSDNESVLAIEPASKKGTADALALIADIIETHEAGGEEPA